MVVLALPILPNFKINKYLTLTPGYTYVNVDLENGSYFTADATMTDDGNLRNFQSFVKEACGKEVFLTIDTVTNGGKDLKGNFKAGQWGTFPVFFHFHENPDGKFDRLDIGQAH
ncbi:hypothetical protein [Chryseobacterium lathyri]|uniref:Uncharacterized protein n=1 Tax=Chryseobacterium lathyri TaxID=395933 RepID=A0ABT9SSP1_9FLAO|nr:hypothetical protein [Chryseobacterium lathyri]MDP9962278.1 hypothetical protein [Chryseobacterium lathyri]